MNLTDIRKFEHNGVYLIGHVTSGDHPIQWDVYVYYGDAFHRGKSSCSIGERIDPEDGELDYEFDHIYLLPKTHYDIENNEEIFPPPAEPIKVSLRMRRLIKWRDILCDDYGKGLCCVIASKLRGEREFGRIPEEFKKVYEEFMAMDDYTQENMCLEVLGE